MYGPIRWEPFREIETLRRQMDQLFSELQKSTVTQIFLNHPKQRGFLLLN